MEIRKACEILGIDENLPIQIEDLKQKYRINALKYHPDKNKAPDAVQRFQEINESYEFLLREEGFSGEPDDLDEPAEGCTGGVLANYMQILCSFLKKVLEDENKVSVLHLVLKKILSVCEKKALKKLAKVDKTLVEKIYGIITTYNDILHLSPGFIEKIAEIIDAKTRNDKYITLNPTLADIMSDNLYKLSIDEQPYFVPLWHTELVYDHLGTDLYVNCYPVLEDNVKIDSKNNVLVKLNYSIGDIWETDVLQIQFAGRIYPIHVSSLFLKREQTVIFSNAGISRINTENIYDVSKRGDILFLVSLHL
jgi:hypothetical protein